MNGWACREEIVFRKISYFGLIFVGTDNNCLLSCQVKSEQFDPVVLKRCCEGIARFQDAQEEEDCAEPIKLFPAAVSAFLSSFSFHL